MQFLAVEWQIIPTVGTVCAFSVQCLAKPGRPTTPTAATTAAGLKNFVLNQQAIREIELAQTGRERCSSMATNEVDRKEGAQARDAAAMGTAYGPI